jgi:hypothetical protein
VYLLAQHVYFSLQPAELAADITALVEQYHQDNDEEQDGNNFHNSEIGGAKIWLLHKGRQIIFVKKSVKAGGF